jgi:hypothetical protein
MRPNRLMANSLSEMKEATHWILVTKQRILKRMLSRLT